MPIDSRKAENERGLNEFYKALSLVVELAEGNCLDSDDPDVANDSKRQLEAVDLVKQFIAGSQTVILGSETDLNPPANRYEFENAVNRIEGYFLPKPHERGNQGEIDAFDRAKTECLFHLERALSCTRYLSLEQFFMAKKRKLTN